MILSCDVGSLPFPKEMETPTQNTGSFEVFPNDNASKSFKQAITNAFIDKLKAGLSVPAFPQFRDMSEMFLSTFEGLRRVKGGYIETKRLTLKPNYSKMLEVVALEESVKEIRARFGKVFKLRICITGPFTLASYFPYKNSEIFDHLGIVLSETVERNIFSTKHGGVSMISIDEPLFGLIDDQSIDRGSESREALLRAWELIAFKARSKGLMSCIHLHNTSDDLFWEVKSLKAIESHVDDPFYEMKATKKFLEKEDKLVKASIAITDFDHLIKMKIGPNASGDAVANVWKSISKKHVKPEKFLENVVLMKKRLGNIVQRLGCENVALAGAECGLRSFPTYASAIESLKRVAEAVNLFKENKPD